MIQGYISYYNTSYIYKINGNMNLKLYNNILDNELIKIIEYYELKQDYIIFQQDNNKKYTTNRIYQ